MNSTIAHQRFGKMAAGCCQLRHFITVSSDFGGVILLGFCLLASTFIFYWAAFPVGRFSNSTPSPSRDRYAI